MGVNLLYFVLLCLNYVYQIVAYVIWFFSKDNCICMPIYTKGITKYVHMIMLKHAKLVISFEASSSRAKIIA